MLTLILCTYNGERFLKPFLDSIADQTLAPTSLFISDDGSSDSTLELLKDYSVTSGPQKGFAQNFMSAFSKINDPGEYIAFADQDDIWLNDKLERAVNILKQYPAHIPALYGSRTALIDENGSSLGFSPLFNKAPSFANALVQNIAGGNTMVINRAAWELIKSCPVDNLVSHDWWFYLLISAAGGNIYYDPQPSLYYRQHGSNLVGSNQTWLSRLYRIKMLMNNRFRDWNDLNIQNLLSHQDKLTMQNKEILNRFIMSRQSPLLSRLYHFKQSGVFRQTRLGMLGLWTASVLNKA